MKAIKGLALIVCAAINSVNAIACDNASDFNMEVLNTCRDYADYQEEERYVSETRDIVKHFTEERQKLLEMYMAIFDCFYDTENFDAIKGTLQDISEEIEKREKAIRYYTRLINQ